MSCDTQVPELKPSCGITVFYTVHRNDSCPCGSRKKFKHCCIKKQGKRATAQRTYLK